MVVVPEPAVKGGGAFGAGAVDRAVGPAGEEGADEAFCFAVGLRPVGPGAEMFDPELAAGDRPYGAGCATVAATVVLCVPAVHDDRGEPIGIVTSRRPHRWPALEDEVGGMCSSWSTTSPSTWPRSWPSDEITVLAGRISTPAFGMVVPGAGRTPDLGDANLRVEADRHRLSAIGNSCCPEARRLHGAGRDRPDPRQMVDIDGREVLNTIEARMGERCRKQLPTNRLKPSIRTRQSRTAITPTPTTPPSPCSTRSLPARGHTRRLLTGKREKPRCAGLLGGGRYWARTSDPQLVELVLSQLS